GRGVLRSRPTPHSTLCNMMTVLTLIARSLRSRAQAGGTAGFGYMALARLLNSPKRLSAWSRRPCSYSSMISLKRPQRVFADASSFGSEALTFSCAISHLSGAGGGGGRAGMGLLQMKSWHAHLVATAPPAVQSAAKWSAGVKTNVHIR